MAVLESRKSLVKVELDKLIRSNGGVIRPNDVVDWARDHPDSALHGEFTWQNTVAAEKWRVHEARNLLQVYVTVLARDTTPVRAFVSLVEDRNDEGGYRVMVDVLSDAVRRDQLLAQALREADAWQRRYSALAELAPIFAAIESQKKRRRKK